MVLLYGFFVFLYLSTCTTSLPFKGEVNSTRVFPRYCSPIYFLYSFNFYSFVRYNYIPYTLKVCLSFLFTFKGSNLVETVKVPFYPFRYMDLTLFFVLLIIFHFSLCTTPNSSVPELP